MAYALVIAMAHATGDPKIQSYRDVKSLRKPVEDLSEAIGVNLSNSGSFHVRRQTQERLSDYKFIVFDGLNHDWVLLHGKSLPTKKLHLLYDRDNRHYDVISKLKRAMA